MLERYDLRGKIALITGGAGLLGVHHAEAILEIGGKPVIFDRDSTAVEQKRSYLENKYEQKILTFIGSVTDEREVIELSQELMNTVGRVEVLINNAAVDPKVISQVGLGEASRLESLTVERWDEEIAVGLTGAFLCSRTFGPLMAEGNGGVIVNVASDLGLIAPNQRLYRQPNVERRHQPVKPVTYSVIKHALIGLTRYLATYWEGGLVRANALCPGGVEAGQDPVFKKRLAELIPAGRMAQPDEYISAIQFLCSDASSYMNGACLVMDGGRTIW
jgi:NAD(P)-dependent dehydrogenase (short-subunit alcohol dehydrogenase family)